MPFNGSGTYVPPGSPTFPPTPGSVISSTYFTTTINDLGSALSITFLRDGSLPLGGNLNLGGNKVTALGAGAVGALSINFNDDATTGIFLNGVGNLCFASGGATKLAVGSAGVAVTGTLSSTGALSTGGTFNAVGAITQNGSQVWHAGNFDKTLYALLTGATFSGTIIGNNGLVVTAGITVNTGGITITAGGLIVSAGGMAVTGGATFSAGIAVTGALSATGAITQAGNQVWHAGNFNPGLYATIASPTFTGTASVPNGEIGTRDLPQTTQAAAFAFASAHRGGHIYYTGAAAAATINTNATTAIPTGSAIVVVNNGSGALTLTRAGGVSLNWNGSNADRILAVGGMATLLKVATDTWFVSGTLLS
jgi:hypothetical protein